MGFTVFSVQLSKKRWNTKTQSANSLVLECHFARLECRLLWKFPSNIHKSRQSNFGSAFLLLTAPPPLLTTNHPLFIHLSCQDESFWGSNLKICISQQRVPAAFELCTTYLYDKDFIIYLSKFLKHDWGLKMAKWCKKSFVLYTLYHTIQCLFYWARNTT